MSATKHTPGPWHACTLASGWPYERHISSLQGFLGVVYGDVRINDDENAANARLIASSPDLLQELQHAHQIIHNALNIMTSDQKEKWAQMNQHAGCDGEGTTRANERLALLQAMEQQT